MNVLCRYESRQDHLISMEHSGNCCVLLSDVPAVYYFSKRNPHISPNERFRMKSLTGHLPSTAPGQMTPVAFCSDAAILLRGR